MLHQDSPASRSCCGGVAYKVGKNTADAYLKKEGEVPVATQYFNNIETEKRKNEKDKKNNNKADDKKGSGDSKKKGVFNTISSIFGN